MKKEEKVQYASISQRHVDLVAVCNFTVSLFTRVRREFLKL